MRRYAVENAPVEQQGNDLPETLSIPAPIKGWNLVDPLAVMDPSFAVQLDNWIPRPGFVEARRGYAPFATGFSDDVESIIPYNGGFTKELFAFSGVGIYDITGGGAIGAAVYAITEAKNWVSQQFTTLAGTYVTAANGTDPVVKYDGTTWTPSAITGVSPSALSHPHAYSQRLWFIERGTLSVWYLAPGAIEGAATRFPMGTIFRQGGRIVAIGSWSVDAGEGLQEYIVFITDQGQVAIYQGSDPTTASGFVLVGVYILPKPLGQKPLLDFGGDLLILTEGGVYPITKGLQSATVSVQSSITYTISPQFAYDASFSRQAYGWEMCLHTADNLILVNVPQANSGKSDQYVMNTITGAWARLRNMDALCWAVFNSQIYFGGANQNGIKAVYTALFGTADDGANIETSMITAYNYFTDRINNKHVKLLRPNFVVNAPINLSMAVSTDFAPLLQYQYASMQALLVLLSNGGIWDTAIWDQNVWEFSLFTPLEWRTTFSKPGFCAAIGLQTMAKNATIQVTSFDVVYETGSVL